MRKLLNVQAFALTTSVQNILNCNITSLAGPIGYTQAQPFLVVTRIRALNKTNAPAQVTLYKGATGASAAGTEVFFAATIIPANDFVDYGGGEERFDAADFLTGKADTNTAIVLQLEVEEGISG